MEVATKKRVNQVGLQQVYKKNRVYFTILKREDYFIMEVKKVITNGVEYMVGQFNDPDNADIPSCYPKVGDPWSIFGMPAIVTSVDAHGFTADTIKEKE